MDDNILPEEIANEEYLYRGIVSLHWEKEKNRISSAAYKNPGGLSVDRDCGRDKDTCVQRLLSSSDFMFVTRLLTGDVRSEGLHPVYKPVQDNVYHSEIHQSGTEVELTKGQARRLNKMAEIAFSKM